MAKKKRPKSTKISGLIEELQKVMKAHGDVVVRVGHPWGAKRNDHPPVRVTYEEFWGPTWLNEVVALESDTNDD